MGERSARLYGIAQRSTIVSIQTFDQPFKGVGVDRFIYSTNPWLSIASMTLHLDHRLARVQQPSLLARSVGIRGQFPNGRRTVIHVLNAAQTLH